MASRIASSRVSVAVLVARCALVSCRVALVSAWRASCWVLSFCSGSFIPLTLSALGSLHKRG